jgi:Domain of unknown function (DUF6285)
MPKSIPDSIALLQGCMRYLQHDLLPALPDDQRFLTRVAIKALGIVERELALGERHAEAELDRLRLLLGCDGTLAELNQLLCDRILSGEADLDDAALRSHLRESLRENLMINNPGSLRGPAAHRERGTP